jgi:septal ring factor EnvC (AmiA/AmiB activator)
MEENRHCSEHEVCKFKIGSTEDKLSKLESKFEAFKSEIYNAIEKIQQSLTDKVDEIKNNYNMMNTTLIRIEVYLEEIKKDIMTMKQERDQAKAQVKTGFIFPLIVGILVGGIGFVLGKLLK